MKENVTLNKKEQKRLMVLNQIERGVMTAREAAEVLGLFLRHVRRIVAAYRKEGAQALAHGNWGRKPCNTLDESLKKRVVELAQSTYAGCNVQHFTELLAERENIPLSRSSVRLILLGAGIKSPRKEPESLEEQLMGKRKPTQFGRIMEELGIISITSLSPQARGRIERLWGTFQDRLVSELRIAGASNREEANRVFWSFLPRYNPRFVVPAAEPGSAYREPPEGFNPDEVFCFKYQRAVGRDNVVRFGEHRLQIMPTNGRLSYVKVMVEVHERMDGSLAVYYQRHCLATKPAPAETPVLRVRNTTRLISGASEPLESAPPIANKILKPKATHPYKPAPNHPWRRGFKMYVDKRG